MDSVPSTKLPKLPLYVTSNPCPLTARMSSLGESTMLFNLLHPYLCIEVESKRQDEAAWLLSQHSAKISSTQVVTAALGQHKVWLVNLGEVGDWFPHYSRVGWRHRKAHGP